MFCDSQWLEKFHEYLVMNKYSENTKKIYKQYAKKMVKNGDDFNQYTLSSIYSRYPHSVHLAFLKAINRCFKSKLEFEDLVARGKRGKNNPLVSFLTIEQIEEIIKAAKDTNLKIILRLMFENGLRVSEALNIHRDNMINDFRQVKGIGKGDKPFLEKVSENTREQLRVLHKYNPNPFPLKYPNIMHQRIKVRTEIQRVAKELGIRTNLGTIPNPHDFRHSFGTFLLNKGFNIREVQELLRHSVLNTVSRYTNVMHKKNLEERKNLLLQKKSTVEPLKPPHF